MKVARAGLKGEFDSAQGNAAGASKSEARSKSGRWSGLSTNSHALPELQAELAELSAPGSKAGAEAPTLQRHVEETSASAADQV